MSLRDDLAKRILAMAFTEIEEDESGIRVVPKPPWYEQAADECIRQMEWARRTVGSRSFVDSADVDSLRSEPVVGPLTLAPEDWRPES